MPRVAVRGVGMTRVSRSPMRSVGEMVGEAIGAALRDANLTPGEIQAAFCTTSVSDPTGSQEMCRSRRILQSLGLKDVPIVSVENACASGSTALWAGFQAVQLGTARLALVVGYHTGAQSRNGAAHDDAVSTVLADRTSEQVRAHMREHGSTVKDFAAIAAKNRSHGRLNEYACHRDSLTADDVLRSPMAVSQLTRPMCCTVADGAAAVVLGPADGRSPLVAASVVRGGSSSGLHGGTTRAATAAYDQVGLGPKDIDIAEVHDATSPAELLAYEDLLLTGPGQGVELLRAGDTAIGGCLPVNTSGGLLSRGHPVEATGLAMVHEVVLQLRGQAGARTVTDARVGLVHNAGGRVADGRTAVAVHILRRP